MEQSSLVHCNNNPSPSYHMPVDFRPFVFLILLSVICGCSSEKRPVGMPPLHPCRVTIIQDGQPLADAMIRLHGTGSGTQWSSSGTTDANGVATLLTQGQFRGVPAGTYKVTVQKVETVSLATPEQLAALEKAKAENPQWYDPPNIRQEFWQLVEEKYMLVESTPLEITVSKGQNNETLDVGKAVRVKQDVTE